MRASSTTLLVALAMAGCSVYDETSPGGAAGAASSAGGSGGPSGGFSGTGGNKDSSSDARANADASGAAGAGATSGAAGSSGVDAAAGGGGTSGAAGSSGVDAATGAGGTSGAAGSSGADGAAGAGGISGAAGTSGDGSPGVDTPPGVDASDTGQPCVTGTGPANLPFAVDQYFVSSGWMQPALIRQDSTCVYPPTTDAGSTPDGGRDGNAGSDAQSDRDGGTVPPLPGSKCWTITYTPTATTDWAGVDWQYPINNWGSNPGLVIPPGAARVSVVAWGDTGTESVTFNVGYGVTSPDAFAASLANQVLSTIPTRYHVDMSGIAYTCNSVRMGFGWVANGGTAITFHLADIRWE